MRPSLDEPAPEFATFWHGPLNAIAYSCLASFARAGAELRLYTYEPAIEAPPGVSLADARRICRDASLLGRYRVGGKPSLATFADRFRYKMIRQTGCCWVDADLICMKRPAFGGEPIVFGRQPEAFGKALVNNAVLKLPPDNPVLGELIRTAEGIVDTDQTWGAIGPFLLTALAERYGIDTQARAPHEFYPIGPDEFWRLLAPSECERVAADVKGATFVHLWGELFDRCGYDKSAGPPVGSFLHATFAELGTLHRFDRIYAWSELAPLIEAWKAGEARRLASRAARDAP